MARPPGIDDDPTINPPVDPPHSPVDKRWVIGYFGTWFILSALAENPGTAEFAGVLALTIAVSMSFVLLPDVAKRFGG